MTESEFKLLARLLKSKEPVISAVHLVIFDGVRNIEAARMVGAVPQAVHRSTGRFLKLHEEIRETFKLPGEAKTGEVIGQDADTLKMKEKAPI